MFTSEEKELLDALTGQMDAEDRQKFNDLSEAEQKEVLRETKRQLDNPMTRVKMVREMGFWDFMKTHAEKGFVGAALMYVVLKMTRSKGGCGCLVAIAIALVILFMLAGSV